MHTKRDYEFATKEEAQEFADQQGGNPSADVYVRGPFLVDEKEVFKSMDWVIPREPFWSVNVEIYK
tara:strand:- start:331 stop:528 length:198 start_codon:yes stop_codon:yes gene_type:complete